MRPVPDRNVRRLRALAGAVALAALLGMGTLHMVYRSGLLLSSAGRWARLTPAEARRRAFGAAYVDAVEVIRRQLPEDAWYLLVPPKDFEETGWAAWLRHDLAPRRPILIESRDGRRLRTLNGATPPRWVRWAILSGDGGAPLLLTREEALDRLRARGGS
jgi:hypothetical protein